MCIFIATEHDCGHKTYQVPLADSGACCDRVRTSPSTNERDCYQPRNLTSATILPYSICTRVTGSTCRQTHCYGDWHARLRLTFDSLAYTYRELAKRFYEFPTPAWTKAAIPGAHRLWKEFGGSVIYAATEQFDTWTPFLQAWSMLKQRQQLACDLVLQSMNVGLDETGKEALDWYISELRDGLEKVQLQVSIYRDIIDDCWVSCKALEDARGHHISEREESIRLRWSWAKQWHSLLHKPGLHSCVGLGDLCRLTLPEQTSLDVCFEKAMESSRPESDDEAFRGFDAWWLARRPWRQNDYDEAYVDRVLLDMIREENHDGVDNHDEGSE